MPRFRVARQSFIGGRVYERGEEVDYDGLPSDNLEPLDDEGRQARANAEREFAKQAEERALAANPSAAAWAAAADRRVQGVSEARPTAEAKPTAPVFTGAGPENPSAARDVRASVHAPATRETRK